MAELTMQEEGATPSTPASGKWKLFFKADGFYFLDDTGLAVGPFTISGASPNATELTINTDAITIVQRSHKLQPQTGTTDDLSTINGTVAGQSGVLYASDFGTDTITIKHNVGNILCMGGTDIPLSYGCVFWYSDGTKVFMSGGGGGASNPFDDGTAIIKGSADATKLLRLEVDGFTTGTTRVLTPQNRDGTLQLSDGWIDGLALGTWAYVSNSAPYGTFNINADVTGVIGIGDRIKFTQTTVKYFVVTAVGAYSGGFTAITIYGFSAIANAAITAPFYSHEKSPFGLPSGLDKKRIVTVTQSATPSINTDNGDVFIITGLAANITSLTTNLSGTPTNGQMMLMEITDDGTGRTIAPGASFLGTSNNTLTGLTTTANKKLMLWWKYNGSVWELVGKDQSL